MDFDSIRIPLRPEMEARDGMGETLEVLRAALASVGTRTDIPTLGGLSGAAFRTYWPAPESARGCEADLTLCIPHDPVAAAAAAYGWRFLRYRRISPAVIWQFSAQSVSRGVPAVAGFEEGGRHREGLVVGCERTAGRRALRVAIAGIERDVILDLEEPRAGDGTTVEWLGVLSAALAHQRLPWESAVQRSLRRAVWMAGTERIRMPYPHAAGMAAYRSAAAAAPDALASRPGPLVEWLRGQAEARSWAAAFATRCASLFPVLGAAVAFDDEAGLWRHAAETAAGTGVVSGLGAPEGLGSMIGRAGDAHARAIECLRAVVPEVPQETDAFDADAEE